MSFFIKRGIEMDRSTLLASKSSELTLSLQNWAMEILGPGEQLVVTLEIKSVPLIVVQSEDPAKRKREFLDMKLEEFFTMDRILQSADSKNLATRTYKSVDRWLDSRPNFHGTLEDFLNRTTADGVGCRGKTLKLLQSTLEKVGLSLRDPSNCLK